MTHHNSLLLARTTNRAQQQVIVLGVATASKEESPISLRVCPMVSRTLSAGNMMEKLSKFTSISMSAEKKAGMKPEPSVLLHVALLHTAQELLASPSVNLRDRGRAPSIIESQTFILEWEK